MWRFKVLAVALFCGLCALGQQSSQLVDLSSGSTTDPVCILHCHTDSTDQITRATLEYLRTDSLFLSETLYVCMHRNNGEVTVKHITTVRFAESGCVTSLPPTTAPAEILGTDAYYQWRLHDFTLRNHVTGLAIPSPDYYLSYGDKYAHRFLHEVKPKLSETGKNWVDNTLLLLQLTNECLLLHDPEAEQHSTSFRRQLFAYHVLVYESTGFFDLSIHDKLRIAAALDFQDLISQEGLLQVKHLVFRYLRHLIRNSISHR